MRWRVFSGVLVHLKKKTLHHPTSKIFALGVTAGVVLLGSLLFVCRDAAARYAWQQWHAPSLAILLDTGDAQLAMDIGDRYFGSLSFGNATPQYDLDIAQAAFEKALSIDPNILWGHYSLSRIAFARGDFTTALSEANAERKANPQNLRMLYVRGLIYGFRRLPGDLYLAETDFRRFNTWAPDEWAGYNDLAWILAMEGKYSDIEPLMQAAFVHVPGGRENPWLWNELGVAQLHLGEYTAARVSFTQALAYADKLTSSDWHRAYSGDSPATDASGLAAFHEGIARNLASAQANQ